MATNYCRGRNLEYRVKELFEKAGYVVVRAAGSKGVADLVAIRPELARTVIESYEVESIDDLLKLPLVLIQVKSKKPTKKERLEYPSFVVIIYRSGRKLKLARCKSDEQAG